MKNENFIQLLLSGVSHSPDNQEKCNGADLRDIHLKKDCIQKETAQKCLRWEPYLDIKKAESQDFPLSQR